MEARCHFRLCSGGPLYRWQLVVFGHDRLRSVLRLRSSSPRATLSLETYVVHTQKQTQYLMGETVMVRHVNSTWKLWLAVLGLLVVIGCSKGGGGGSWTSDCSRCDGTGRAPCRVPDCTNGSITPVTGSTYNCGVCYGRGHTLCTLCGGDGEI